MRLNSCPHCRTRSGLTDYLTLLLSLENWPLILVYSFLVISFGNKLEFSQSLISAFVVVTVIPLLFQVIRKQACENCGAEFREVDDKAAVSHSDLL